MKQMSSRNRAKPPRQPRSRRSVLRDGTFLGLSAVAGVRLGSQVQPRHTEAPLGGTSAPQATGEPSGRLVLDYQPSQPTGWPKEPEDTTVGVTIGGHTPSVGFTFADTAYTVSLLSFGQPGTSPDPIFEDVPADPTIQFSNTLASAFDPYYSFTYKGDSPEWGAFSVQSYSVFVQEPNQSSPALNYGAELYVVYLPGPSLSDPVIRKSLQWIQVVTNSVATFVDDSGRANPFYIWGGLTSIYGNQVVNFDDRPQATAAPGSMGALPNLFMAELFLVEDAGIKDGTGKDVAVSLEGSSTVGS